MHESLMHLFQRQITTFEKIPVYNYRIYGCSKVMCTCVRFHLKIGSCFVLLSPVIFTQIDLHVR